MQVLRLANEDQTVIVDLLSGPFRLRSGWEDQTPGMGGSYTYEPYGAQFSFGNYQPVSESFDLAIKGRPSVVLAAMDQLQDFLESIRLFHSGDLAAKSCWLEWSADCDENAKRSLLYSGQFKVTSQDDVTPTATKAVIIGRLTLTRHPLWENKTILEANWYDYYAEISTGLISTLGGKYDYTGVIGNTPARIGTIRLTASAGADLYRAWVGIRRFNQGVTNFEPVWECEFGTNGTDAADAVDATASAGNKVTVTYATLTLVSRLTTTVLQICTAAGHAEPNDFQGRYLVLLRCKVSAAGTSGVQMRSGYTGNIIADEQFVDNTNWRLIPLGNISIPPWEGNSFGDHAFYYNFRIDIYAEQLTAGHNLDLDCLVLIPNEHLLVLEGFQNLGTVHHAYAHTMEDERELAFDYSSAAFEIADSIEPGFTDWYLPPDSGTIIMAAEDQNDHDLGETIRAYVDYIPRWLLYRTD